MSTVRIKAVLMAGWMCLSFFALTTQLQAKPSLTALAPNIADTGSAYYQFQIRYFSSADQQRRYKVWLGLPRTVQSQAKPAPALFMLDGNSAMSYLSEELLQKLSIHQAPVLVAIGYDTNRPFDTAARALDYTPADATGKISADPHQPERLSGGSAQFREVLLQQIQPWVASQVQLDPQRQALWGHSYGGLFVLDSLLHAQYFSHYFAASPSLSWADARMMNKLQSKAAAAVQTSTLWVMEGDLAAQHQGRASPNFNPNTVQDNRQVIASFEQRGVQSKLLLYPNRSHGQMFSASLLDVLNYSLF
ncbi:alpha/beta hydrolase [Acinetobacter zhairhuonensis]|uniref:alpha/beta hydrolase n=1 Tax=Acinetobacter sp. A7.4 TaxID=2919921 RepID=UPI001F4ECE88|nr:alpha/beta hydrolase-fold protein [Acinetobacter sp. A7.4]MCJ8160927.1 alpha/beta hydrolase-fold protein [Acinetobacter sp. A7.4]